MAADILTSSMTAVRDFPASIRQRRPSTVSLKQALDSWSQSFERGQTRLKSDSHRADLPADLSRRVQRATVAVISSLAGQQAASHTADHALRSGPRSSGPPALGAAVQSPRSIKLASARFSPWR